MTSTQAEQELENKLVEQLIGLGYERAIIRNESDLLKNLKIQLEKHNNKTFSDNEFERVLNHLNRGTVFDRATILRDKMHLKRDDGTSTYIEFLDVANWCQNQFQVTQQVSNEGTYKNRYDVTILINGLPLVQIELKRRGLGIKEAFNQTNRYQRHSYSSSYGLFNYIQIFVISNGVNTKYYANNRHQSFGQTFYWTHPDNIRVSQLSEFVDTFLDPCHVSKMICQYIVLHQSDKVLMVLRPYQYYASEAIIDLVKNSTRNGYIWHTTGSGKTLTSFKTSQVLTGMPNIEKVVFVVDRKDLDYQTTKEFNSFSEGSIGGTDNTAALATQFSDSTKLIVTTIQKLNTAISKRQHQAKMEDVKDEKMVFIFDECHRSQFGETHNRIKKYFGNVQMFGFTGTPIFKENSVKNELGKRTTKDLFDDCLHKYVITDAIRDDNVLKFAVEYVGKYKPKNESNNSLDIDVEAIDTNELLESEQRLEKIADYVIAQHGRKTHNRTFAAMMCVGNISSLIKYYEIFRRKKAAGEHRLKIGTIFSYGVNEEDPDADGSYIFEEPETTPMPVQASPHSRDKLEEFIGDYNELFNTRFTTKDGQSFYNYYNDISRRAKNKELDLLLVVNMFLTGFDSPGLNTLFVDKNLRYHGLIQAYSRTNRILNELKSQGNIVAFRNLKNATDEAITLFANKEAIEEVIVEPMEVTVEKFNKGVEELKAVVPTVNSVDALIDEEAELRFIKAFRSLMRLRNQLITFADFDYTELAMTGQEFEDYKSKYLDLYEKVRLATGKEKVSILDDVDFEVELIHRDEINVRYILALLAIFHGKSEAEKARIRQQIDSLLSGELKLRSKRELILEFIDNNMPNIADADLIGDEFDAFWQAKEREAFARLCTEEAIDPEKAKGIIADFLFTEQRPMPDAIIKLLGRKPKLLERKSLVERITSKILNFIDVFISGIGDI
jgi:type I restriction enzyme R subunit